MSLTRAEIIDLLDPVLDEVGRGSHAEKPVREIFALALSALPAAVTPEQNARQQEAAWAPCGHEPSQGASQLHGICLFCYRDRLGEALRYARREAELHADCVKMLLGEHDAHMECHARADKAEKERDAALAHRTPSCSSEK